MPKGKHFSEAERICLQNIVLQYKNIIENKQTDSLSLQKKNLTWDKITQEFNSNADNNPKDTAQLKNFWESIKFRRRAELTAERRAAMMTGGGPRPSGSSSGDPELDSLLTIDMEFQDAIDCGSLLLTNNSVIVIDGPLQSPENDANTNGVDANAAGCSNTPQSSEGFCHCL